MAVVAVDGAGVELVMMAGVVAVAGVVSGRAGVVAGVAEGGALSGPREMAGPETRSAWDPAVEVAEEVAAEEGAVAAEPARNELEVRTSQ